MVASAVFLRWNPSASARVERPLNAPITDGTNRCSSDAVVELLMAVIAEGRPAVGAFKPRAWPAGVEKSVAANAAVARTIGSRRAAGSARRRRRKRMKRFMAGP